MRKTVLLIVAVLLGVRLAAQTTDTIVTQQELDVPTVTLSDSDFDESSTSVNDASTLLHSSRDVSMPLPPTISVRYVTVSAATTRSIRT